MKLSLAQIVPCIKSKKYKFYVLYGSQETLIQGLVREVMEVFSYQNTFADQIEGCVQDLQTPCLFGSKPLVTIAHSPKLSILTSLLSHWPQEHVLIALVSSCPPALMKDANVACVACYESTLSESKLIFQRYVERCELKLTPQAFQLCTELSRDGRWSSMAQMLGVCHENPLTQDTVEALFPEACPLLSMAFLGETSLELEKIIVDEPIKILRLWQKGVMQLWQLKFYSQNNTLEQAVKLVHPPLFFKNVPSFVKAIKSWSELDLIKTMESLLTLETLVKKNAAQSDMLIVRFLKDQIAQRRS